MRSSLLVALVLAACGRTAYFDPYVPPTDGGAATGAGDLGTVTGAPAWGMIGGDPQRTSRSPWTGPEVAPRSRFSAVLPGPGGSPVVGGDGTIYVTAGDWVLALEPTMGVSRWVVKPGAHPQPSMAIALDGTLLVALDTPSAGLAALDPRTGKTLWTQALETVASPPVVSADGTTYLGTTSGTVAAVSASGKLLWDSAVVGAPVFGLAIDHSGFVVAVTPDRVLRIEPMSGKALWAAPESSAGGTKPAALQPAIGPDNTIFILLPRANSNALIVALDPATGRERYSKNLGGPGFNFGNPAVGLDGSVYLSGAGAVGHLDPAGKLLWSVNLIATGSPLLGNDGWTYMAGSDAQGGALFAVNATGTAHLSFSTAFGASPSQGAIGPDGVIYFSAVTQKGAPILQAISQ